MPKAFTRIDATTIGEHVRLVDADEIYFLYEYTSGQNFSFGATNSPISNLKKSPLLKGSNQYRYKLRDMAACSRDLGSAINPVWLSGATLVPVAPSKARGHAEYDDRMIKICRNIPAEFALDVREIVMQTASREAAHVTTDRPGVAELLAIYEIDEALTDPVPIRLAIMDDVLTADTHYRAMHSLLSQRFPHVPIVGMFVARRTLAQNDAALDFVDC